MHNHIGNTVKPSQELPRDVSPVAVQAVPGSYQFAVAVQEPLNKTYFW